MNESQPRPSQHLRATLREYIALAFILDGRLEQAVQWAREAVLVPNSQYWARSHLAAVLGHLGWIAEAAATLEELKSIKPGVSLALVREQLFKHRAD